MLGHSLLIAAVKRAFTYQVSDYAAVERIVRQIIIADTNVIMPVAPDTPSDFSRRPAYLDGRFCRENDIDYENLNGGKDAEK